MKLLLGDERNMAVRKHEPASESALEAVRSLNMLDGVHRLGIGVSGGADSLALLDAMIHLRARGDIASVEVVPIYIDQYLDGTKVQMLEDFLQLKYGLPLQRITADTRSVASSLLAVNKAPCRGCAPIRAKAFGQASTDLNLDAVMLGHHLVDVMATLLMNIFHRGSAETMRPVVFRRENGDVPVLRPFYFTDERVVKAASPAGPGGLFSCDVCTIHSSERERARAFVEATFLDHPISIRMVRQTLERLRANPSAGAKHRTRGGGTG